MRVLHDWDHPQINRGWAFRRGRQLLNYAFRSKLGVPTENNEAFEYLQTLLMLDKLVGVQPVVGLRDIVTTAIPGIRRICEDYGALVHSHHHIGDNSDPNRIRTWDPPLNQGPESWHYDQDYARRRQPKLRPDSLSVFHIDYPWLLPEYIRFLYETLILGRSIY